LRRWYHAWFLPPLFTALLFAGCAVGPNYTPPEATLPLSWNGQPDPGSIRGDADISRWWTVFNDPLLNDLIEQARQGNLDLKTAYARVKEARAQIGVAASQDLPAIEPGGQAIVQRTSEHDIASGGSTDTQYTLNVGVSWEADVFGRIRRSIEAAKADYESTEEDRIDLMISLYADVATYYFDLRTYQAGLDVTVKNIRSQRKVLELTESRFRNGLASGLDVAQAQSVLATSEAELPPLRIQLSQSFNTLAILLGRRPEDLRKDLIYSGALPEFDITAQAGVPIDLLRQRPDIRSSERQLAAAVARVGEATANMYPVFSLSGVIGLVAKDFGNLFKVGSYYYSAGPSLVWTLYKGGQLRSLLKVADAQAEQALYQYEQTLLNALAEVEVAIVTYNEQRRRVEALMRAVAASRKTLDLAISLYKDGLADFQNVLDAQRSMLDNENQLVTAKGDAAISLVSLYKALGGGWDPNEPRSADET